MSTQRKVAVITGASQGIGAGLVRGFLDRGYRVVANSRSIKPEASADILAVAGDIADPAVAERVIGAAVAKFGRIDTLVNNAGVFVPNLCDFWQLRRIRELGARCQRTARI